MSQPSLVKSILKKGMIGVLVGVILALVAKFTHFPLVFQAMFFVYAMLGAVVFILLDAPSMQRVEGWKAVVALVLFYVGLSGVYVAGASLWPQFDPEIEKGKIVKILKAKRAKTQQGKMEELLARAKTLQARADSITKQLNAAGFAHVASQEGPGLTFSMGAASGDLVAQGKEQWDLQECYNCHKLFGVGGKKRGPKLDNIGNLMTPEQLAEKILKPKSWMAEGFEKQYKKGKMPDKYADLMEDSEIQALVAFLATLRDTSVDTPKPINCLKPAATPCPPVKKK